MKSLIDMGRPTTFYTVGLAILMVLSLVLSNVPETNLSQYVLVPHSREIAAGLLGGGTCFGLLALLRHIGRVKAPWKVPQSQASIFYGVFFILTLAALVISK